MFHGKALPWREEGGCPAYDRGAGDGRRLMLLRNGINYVLGGFHPPGAGRLGRGLDLAAADSLFLPRSVCPLHAALRASIRAERLARASSPGALLRDGRLAQR